MYGDVVSCRKESIEKVGDLIGESCKNSGMSMIILIEICAMKKPEHSPPFRLFRTNRIPDSRDGVSIFVRGRRQCVCQT